MSDKKSKKGIQGSELPAPGSPLSAYPVGACVVLEIDGEEAWHLIAYRIGGSGNPHVRRLVHAPETREWNAGPSRTREVKDSLPVLRSAWPRRVADERTLDAEQDPDPLLAGLRIDEPGMTDMRGEGGS